jgi:hypothetical protein
MSARVHTPWCWMRAASTRSQDILAACHTRLCAEHDPATRAGLVLAIAQLARAHQVPVTAEWMRSCWSNPARPPEVRVSAAVGWLCLTDEPVPHALRAVMDDLATDGMARLMAPLPWMDAVENARSSGLHRCVRAMLPPGDRSDEAESLNDPWA